ncbi:MAG: hypothetical protein CVT64_11320 [Actinobacteria bacterium HGW-Actinobacteria-4]|nr:MAG: hypothetical protein CVT64_11320 [Actinobacteria bacterium HGW-Actinobacteria-4]
MTATTKPTGTKPGSPTLTDRYVYAALKHVPAQQRDDLEPELRASIADATDARVTNGEAVDAAEVAVLQDLGDPEALAATYADRPLHLIGPRFFLDYKRILILLLSIVVPIVTVVIGVTSTLGGASLGSAILEALMVGGQLIVHLFFWITLAAVVLERVAKPSDKLETEWTVGDLPEVVTNRISIGETLWSLVWIAIAASVIVWQQVQPFDLTRSGQPVPVLNPDLWTWAWPLILVLLATEAALVIRRHLAGIWTTASAALNAGLNAAYVIVLMALLTTGTLLNPAFVTQLENVTDPLGSALSIAAIASFVVLVAAILDTVEGWRKARRGHRAAP